MNEQLQAFFANLAAAAQAGDREAYTALFRHDASIFIPHLPPLIGRAAIGEWFTDVTSRVELVLSSYDQEQINVVGDTVMIRSRATGHYRIRSTDQQVPFDQKYLDVLVHEDEALHMAYHVASSSTMEPGVWDQEWNWVWGETASPPVSHTPDG